ncbi:MAG: DUF4397 domain-containing protein [Rhodothermales bacterium]
MIALKKLTMLPTKAIWLALLFVQLGLTQFATAQDARVQVIHNSPYAEAAVVDVYINDGLAIDDFAFRDATEFLDLPSGVPVKIDITAADAADNTSPVFTADLTAGLPAGGTLTVIAAGDPLARAGNPAFDLYIGEAREAAATGGNAEFQVFHGSPDAPTVDVAARGAGILVDDISFGEFAADYLSVPPASYDLDIQTADNSATAASFNADLSGAADAALTVLASGFLAPATSDDPGFGLLAVFADGTTALLAGIDPPPAAMAKLQVVHNSPYAEAAIVDVYVNDALALDDVAFRDATGFLELPAEVPVKIDVTGSTAADNSAPVFTLNLDAGLPANATLIGIAAGDPLARAGNPAFNIFVAEAREAAATAGNAEFLVFHGSPDAPTVDVAARGVGVLVDDISFGEYAPDYLSVAAASYDIDIQTADNSATAASFNADLSGAADAAIAVLASGFLAPATSDDPGFGLLAVFADGTTALLPAIDAPPVPMARLQVVHNSPYAEAAVVDVYVNDALALDDVAFRDATGFLDLPAEVPVKIDVTGSTAADNSAPVFTLNLDAGLPTDATLIGIAAGDPLGRAGNPAFNIFVAEAREAAATAGNAEFLVFHGSPDAPTVDVAARGVGVLVDDISFGEYAPDYLSVAAASYDIDIQTADNSATAASFNADLSGAADAAIAVLASGFLAPATSDDPGFGLLAVFADGTTALLPAIDAPGPAMARVQVVHNAPYAEAAVVDVYINDALALDDFAFQQATPFLDLPAGVSVKLDVTGADAADNSSPVFSVTLTDGLPEATIQVVAAGDPLARSGNPPFNLFISEAQEAAATAGNVELLVFHGSPDAPAVDIVVRGVGAVLDDFEFGQFSDGYLSVPPARYEFDVETADNSVTAASFEAELSGAADAAVSVLASGFLAPATDDDPGFGLLAVFADGTTALLPALEEGVTFTLIDAESDTAIPAFDPMPQDAVLDLSALPAYVNIRANISDAGSVQFGLNDNASARIESAAPYALCGDIEGNYLPCHLPVGTHTVTATAYAEGNASGEAGESGSITFSVVSNGNAVTSFVLVDADTEADLFVLEDGMTLDLSSVPANLNVRAETGDKVKSVYFSLDPTPYTRIENVSPFALLGDISGDYFGGSFAAGENTLMAKPFSDTRMGGEEGEALSITFNVTGESAGKALVRVGSSEEAVVTDVLSLDEENFDTQPDSYELFNNYPNPFNPTTTIAFTLPEQAQVQLFVYDMLGRQVSTLVNGSLNAGKNEVVFDAVGLPTGTYLYRLVTPQGTFTKKMLLVK